MHSIGQDHRELICKPQNIRQRFFHIADQFLQALGHRRGFIGKQPVRIVGFCVRIILALFVIPNAGDRLAHLVCIHDDNVGITRSGNGGEVRQWPEWLSNEVG